MYTSTITLSIEESIHLRAIVSRQIDSLARDIADSVLLGYDISEFIKRDYKELLELAEKLR